MTSPPFNLPLTLEIRDITQNAAWFQVYQYEIPVLCRLCPGGETTPPQEMRLPRPSPRLSVAQLQKFLQKHL